VSAQDFKAPASVDRLQRAGLFAGGVAALLAVAYNEIKRRKKI